MRIIFYGSFIYDQKKIYPIFNGNNIYFILLILIFLIIGVVYLIRKVKKGNEIRFKFKVSNLIFVIVGLLSLSILYFTRSSIYLYINEFESMEKTVYFPFSIWFSYNYSFLFMLFIFPILFLINSFYIKNKWNE